MTTVNHLSQRSLAVVPGLSLKRYLDPTPAPPALHNGQLPALPRSCLSRRLRFTTRGQGALARQRKA